MIHKKSKVFVTGHNGLVGSAVVRRLKHHGYKNIVTIVRKKLDLKNQQQVFNFFRNNKIDAVINAAATVGGIHANNKYKADFIYDNLIIQSNIIHSCYQNKVKSLIFLGSSCIYPRNCKQPIKEKYLLNGELEKTNEPYAIAKIAGIKLCESYNRQYSRDYRSVMPTNLYGFNDNFHSENSHVIPSLIRRFHDAKLAGAPVVKAWGTGKPRREFLFVDEMAEASIFVMNLDREKYQRETLPMLSHINVGTGVDCTIKELTETVARVIGFQGEIKWDSTKSDGSPRKLMNVSCLERLGWKAQISLEEGLASTYKWFLANQDGYRK